MDTPLVEATGFVPIHAAPETRGGSGCAAWCARSPPMTFSGQGDRFTNRLGAFSAGIAAATENS